MPVRGPFDVVIRGVNVRYKLYQLSGKGTSNYKVKCCKDFDANAPLPESRWKNIGVSKDDEDTVLSRIREILDQMPSGEHCLKPT